VSATYNIVCEQATTFNFQFIIKNDSTPWNITNYSSTLTVRPFLGASTTLLVASTSSGQITLDGPNGTVTVNLSATVTGGLVPGRFVYDLILNSGSVVTRVLEGQFIVTGAVTTSV
jgi:hypothetical protein